MKKLILSRFSLLLMLALLVHLFVVAKVLTANGKHANNDNLSYKSLSLSMPEQAGIASNRIATLFNIAPYVKPDAATESAMQEQKDTAVKLKLLAITLRSDAYQAVIAIEQSGKSSVQTVIVGDTVANLQVQAISKFELTLQGENGELQTLELFKSSVRAKSPEQNKEN